MYNGLILFLKAWLSSVNLWQKFKPFSDIPLSYVTQMELCVSVKKAVKAIETDLGVKILSGVSIIHLILLINIY